MSIEAPLLDGERTNLSFSFDGPPIHMDFQGKYPHSMVIDGLFFQFLWSTHPNRRQDNEPPWYVSSLDGERMDLPFSFYGPPVQMYDVMIDLHGKSPYSKLRGRNYHSVSVTYSSKWMMRWCTFTISSLSRCWEDILFFSFYGPPIQMEDGMTELHG